jgi:hypothetical protein
MKRIERIRLSGTRIPVYPFTRLPIHTFTHSPGTHLPSTYLPGTRLCKAIWADFSIFYRLFL